MRTQPVFVVDDTDFPSSDWQAGDAPTGFRPGFGDVPEAHLMEQLDNARQEIGCPFDALAGR